MSSGPSCQTRQYRSKKWKNDVRIELWWGMPHLGCKATLVGFPEGYMFILVGCEKNDARCSETDDEPDVYGV